MTNLPSVKTTLELVIIALISFGNNIEGMRAWLLGGWGVMQLTYLMNNKMMLV